MSEYSEDYKAGYAIGASGSIELSETITEDYMKGYRAGYNDLERHEKIVGVYDDDPVTNPDQPLDHRHVAEVADVRHADFDTLAHRTLTV